MPKDKFALTIRTVEHLTGIKRNIAEQEILFDLCRIKPQHNLRAMSKSSADPYYM